MFLFFEEMYFLLHSLVFVLIIILLPHVLEVRSIQISLYGRGENGRATIRPICKKRQLVPNCLVDHLIDNFLKIEIKELNQ